MQKYIMGWFEAFRGEQGYTSYGDRRTAALIDLPLAAVTYFCTLIAIATVIASLGIRGKDKWGTVVRSFYGVAVGSIILVSLYGHCWLMGKENISSTYVYRSPDMFTGEVGIQVGLHGANVTLRGYFGEPGRRGEVIYSEALPWPDFGHEEEHLSVYLLRGLPDPILRVTEYLCTDSGGLRWGRSFHLAGNLASALLWTSFAFWLITNLLLFTVIVYGAYMMVLTGTTMFLASIVYHVLMPTQSLAITFDDVSLKTHYGWCFWLTLITGVTTIVFGVILLLLEHFIPKRISEFFRVETSIGEDERYDTLINDTSRRSSVFSVLDKRGSIFQGPNVRKQSIFSEPDSRRSSIGTNGWFAQNRAFVNDHGRSQSQPALYPYDVDIIVEEEENVSSDENQVTESDVRIEIEPDLSTTSSVGITMTTADSENRVNDLNEKHMSANSNKTQLGVTTINIKAGRSRKNSSDSGHGCSENCCSSAVSDSQSITS
ncbi:dual oxidase maturation factor 1 isoform X2 [Patella vulgata]|uniref:dual oxidase maturation factor 1 isoform X2 n=1 Tax=Patella vulgata TaxID=6465 RepID=UPI0024A95996|nr:dual oxidase maturation factor 1 isoform X2 [Patella vulgata]